MKKLRLLSGSMVMLVIFIACSCSNQNTNEITTFYKVPLVCGAAPEIGCGSRLKPLFIDTEKEKEIKESWSNRQGTVIAIVWNGTANEELIQSLFKKHAVEADIIAEKQEKDELMTSLKGKGKWYKGMDVDQLSIEEAGVIAGDLTTLAKDSGLISQQEAALIRKDLEDYFKKELVVVRTITELGSMETQNKWRQDSYTIYIKHVGQERADKVSTLYKKVFLNKEDCNTEEECGDKGKKDCCEKKK